MLPCLVECVWQRVLKRAEWSFQRATQSESNNATAEERRMNILMRSLVYGSKSNARGRELSEYFSHIFNITEILMREVK